MCLEILNDDRKKLLTHVFRGALIGFAIGGVLIYVVLQDSDLFFPFEDLNFKEKN